MDKQFRVMNGTTSHQHVNTNMFVKDFFNNFSCNKDLVCPFLFTVYGLINTITVDTGC